jgi:hypothetical protein
MLEQSCRESKVEPEDAMELQRCYLEALLRVETHAAQVAHELGLGRLGELIHADKSCIERQLLELTAEQQALQHLELPRGTNS